MAGQGTQTNRRQVRPGRQELKMIPNEEARHVSFSKRRHGLFTKASELATLCGAKVAIIVNSPAGRPFTFGSPNVDQIFRKFLTKNVNNNVNNRPNDDDDDQRCMAMVNNVNQQCVELMAKLESVAVRRKVLNDRLKRTAKQRIGELGVEELGQLLETLCRTKERIMARKDAVMNEDGVASSSSSSQVIKGCNPTDPHFFQMDQINSGTGIDTSFNNPGLVFNFGGANNNAMMQMQPPYGFSFGPFNNNQLYFGPNEISPSQSYGMNNPPVPYNTNYRPNRIDSGSLASLIWPSGSIPQLGQYIWGTDSFGQNMLPGFGTNFSYQAGPSINPGMNSLIAGPVDPEDENPVARNSGKGPH